MNPAINNAPWTKEEEMVVMKAGKRQEGKDWKKIADIVGVSDLVIVNVPHLHFMFLSFCLQYIHVCTFFLFFMSRSC